MKNYLLVSLLLLIMFFPFSLQQQQDLPLHMKIKTLLTNVQSYLFPPNLDFRGSVGNDEPEPTVKEAVAKSLTEGKATVEETAKTAAEKLKETFSSHHDTQEDL
ncbi:hypothetical protein LXL04_009143 [Taraxacum kok-saghyz]